MHFLIAKRLQNTRDFRNKRGLSSEREERRFVRVTINYQRAFCRGFDDSSIVPNKYNHGEVGA